MTCAEQSMFEESSGEGAAIVSMFWNEGRTLLHVLVAVALIDGISSIGRPGRWGGG